MSEEFKNGYECGKNEALHSLYLILRRYKNGEDCQIGKVFGVSGDLVEPFFLELLDGGPSIVFNKKPVWRCVEDEPIPDEGYVVLFDANYPNEPRVVLDSEKRHIGRDGHQFNRHRDYAIWTHWLPIEIPESGE